MDDPGRVVLSVLAAALLAAACSSGPHLHSTSSARAPEPMTASAISTSTLASSTATGPTAASHGNPGATIPSRQVATVQMINPNVGIALTTTFVLSCQPPQNAGSGCNTVATARPLNLVLTHDGGRIWAISGRPLPASQKAGEFAALAFNSSVNGYVAVGGELLFTDDGGSRWRRVTAAGQVESLTRAGRTAWVILNDCPPNATPAAECPTRVAQTTMTGTVTKLQTVPVAGANLVGTPASTVAVFATTNKTGTWLLTTVDSGRTWSRHRDPCTFGGGSLVGTDARQWWLLCAQDTGMNHDFVDIYETTDSGVTRPEG